MKRLYFLLLAISSIVNAHGQLPLENKTGIVIATLRYDTDPEFCDFYYPYRHSKCYLVDDSGNNGTDIGVDKPYIEPTWICYWVIDNNPLPLLGTPPRYFKQVLFGGYTYDLTKDAPGIIFYENELNVDYIDSVYIGTNFHGSEDWDNYSTQVKTAIKNNTSYTYQVSRTHHYTKGWFDLPYSWDYQYIVKVLPKLLNPVLEGDKGQVFGGEFIYKIHSGMHAKYVDYWQYRIANANGVFDKNWVNCVNGRKSNSIDFGLASFISNEGDKSYGKRVQVRYVTDITDCDVVGRASNPIEFLNDWYRVPDFTITGVNHSCNTSLGFINQDLSSYYVFDGEWLKRLNVVDLQKLEAKDYNLLFFTKSINEKSQKPCEIKLTINSPLTINSVAATLPTCPNQKGSVSFKLKGGTGNITIYLMKDGVPIKTINSQAKESEGFFTFSDIVAGNYFIKASDESRKNDLLNKDCNISSNSFVIPQINPINTNEKIDLAKCYEGNSCVTINVNGGTPPYKYNWGDRKEISFDNNIFKVENISFKDGVNYSYKIVDNNGCESIPFSVNSSNPAPLTLTLERRSGVLKNPSADYYTMENCDTQDGSVRIILNHGGGSGTGYTLKKDGVITTIGSEITLLPRDNPYEFELADNNGCLTTKKLNVKVYPKLTLALNSQTNACGGNDGGITLTPSGGTSIYKFENGTIEEKPSIANNTYTINNLSAGKYNITVSDGYCSQNINDITLNPPVTFSATSIMDCTKDNSDIAISGLAGGNESYTYNLLKGGVSERSGSLSKGGSRLVDLNSGSYKLSIISDGCVSVVDPIAVYNKPTFLPFVVVNPDCQGGIANVTVNVKDGSPKLKMYYDGLQFVERTRVFTTPQNINFRLDDECPDNRTAEVKIPELSVIASGSSWKCHTSLGKIKATVNTTFDSYTIKFIKINSPTDEVLVETKNSKPKTNEYFFDVSEGGSYKIKVNTTGCGAETTINEYGPDSYLKIISAIPTNPTCYGEEGKVVVEVEGLTTGRTLGSEGVSPLVVGSVATFSDKSGTRTYRVNDGFCYLNTDSIPIADPVKPSFTSSIDNPPCNGDKAKVTFTNVAPVGGVYTYHVGTAKYDDASFMLPVVGSRTEVELSVVNEKGCASDAREHTIAMPDVLQSAFTAVPVRCNKGTDGKIILGATGGTIPYNFSKVVAGVETALTGAEYTNLIAGSYTVKVTDDHRCSTTGNPQVVEPAVLTFTADPTSPKCYNGNDGSIAVHIEGGNVGPYKYSLDGQPFSDLASSKIIYNRLSNSYNVTIQDEKKCEASKLGVVVKNQPLWNWDISTLDPTCSTNGEIKINSIANGYGDYKYYKDNSTGASIRQPLTNLAVGGHVVTVIDSKNCVQTTKPTLNDNALTVTTMPKHVTCYGGKDGAIEVTISGGRKNKDGAYTCKLMKGALEISSNVAISSDNQTITYSKLGEGTYTLSVSDASECRETKDITLTQFDKLIDFTVTPFEANTCQEKGRIEVSNIIGYQGVKSDLVFSAGNLVQKDNHTFIVYPGPYSVTVTDSKGCNTTKKIVLTPEQLTAELVPLPMDCSGNNNGSVKINQLKGGIGQLTTSCRLVSEAVPLDNEYKPQLEYGGLKPGKYIVYGRDENNRCKMSVGDFEVKDVEPLLLTYGYNSPTCNGYSDAVVNLQVTGGNGAYTLNAFGKEIPIAEENGKIGGFAKVEGIKAGSYPINLTDKNSCPNKGTDNIVVNEPDPITLNLEKADDVDCKGNANGRIYLTAQGGNGRYTYTTTKDGAAYKVDDNQIDSYLLDKLSPATYAFDVKDRKGCLLTSKIPAVTIAEPNLLTLAVDSFADLTCYKNATGSITVKPSGGNAGAMKYAIGGGALQESPTFGSLAMGNYSLTVKDSKGCTAAVSKSLAEPTLLEVTSLSLVNPSCFEYRGSIIPALKGGTAPYYTKVDGYGSYAAPAKVELPDGSYTLWYKDANGCEFNQPLKIVQPQKLEVSEAIKAPLCTGFDGKVTLTATGGTSKYEFLLGAAGYSATSEYTVKKGSYGISVKDAQGCIASKDITVGEPLPLTLASEHANPLCNGLMGSITLNAGGGTAPYHYTNVFTGIFPLGGLIEGGSSQKVTFGGLKPNVAFTPAVRDAHGCMLSVDPITLAQPDALSWQPDIITNLKCAGDASGVAKVEVVGGTVPYTYTLNDSENGDGRFSRLGGGMYNVKASDSHGCALQKSISLFEPTPLTVNTSLDVQRCFTLCDGRITAYPAGGTIPYTISWNNPTLGSSNMLTNLCGGAYLLNVKDGNGCEVNKDLSFATPEQILINVGFKDTILCKGQTIKVAPQPDKWGLMWLHNSKFLANGSNYVVTLPGSYTVKAIDAKGCTVDFGFGVTYLNDAMNPDFLISSKVAATDTIVVVDISNPKPTLVDWKYDSNARIIEKNDRYLYLAYDKPGIYTLGMVAHAGSCATSIEKRIEVGPKEDRFEINKSLGAKDNILKSFKLYPNPTSGVFKVKVVLNRPADIRLQLMSISNGVLLDTKELRGTDTYEVEFDRQDLKQGFYIINLTVEGQAFGLKMVKI
jgi:hypothetical protein